MSPQTLEAPIVGGFGQFASEPEPPPPVWERVYYDPATKEYLWPKPQDGWVRVTEQALRRLLKGAGVSPSTPAGSLLSPLDAAINAVQVSQDLSYAGPLAGYQAGLHCVDGQRLLVTSSPKLIAPVAGDWPVLRSFVENLLGTPEHDQTVYLYGWLKVATEALRTGTRRPGQMLALAGPAGCGKSLLQNLLTTILGGRSAKPYQYMTGQTAFNADLFGAEHLMIEDEAASFDIRARRKLGAELKQIAVNDSNRFHPKGRQAIMLRPFWRITLSVNDEPENLMVLPPLDESIRDKVLLLRANANAVPWPTTTTEERTAFMAAILAELPSFMAFLESWPVPSSLRSSRYGIEAFQHPDLLKTINGLSPEMTLWNMICDEVLKDRTEWDGTSRELERRLTASSSGCSFEAQRLLTFNTACGTYLARLRTQLPHGTVTLLNQSKNNRRWKLIRCTEI